MESLAAERVEFDAEFENTCHAGGKMTSSYGHIASYTYDTTSLALALFLQAVGEPEQGRRTRVLSRLWGVTASRTQIYSARDTIF